MSSAVDLFVLGGGMRSVPAHVVGREGDEIRMRVAGLDVGAAVFFQPEAGGDWVWGRVVAVDDDGVSIHVQGLHRPDRREFARVWGPVHVRYQRVAPDQVELVGRRWIASGDGAERRWSQPELFMNFSGSGLRFEGGSDLDAGDRVLVGVRVPDDPREHRFVADVIRSGSQHDHTALHFTEATDGAVLALVDLAERIQEQALDDVDG